MPEDPALLGAPGQLKQGTVLRDDSVESVALGEDGFEVAELAPGDEDQRPPARLQPLERLDRRRREAAVLGEGPS